MIFHDLHDRLRDHLTVLLLQVVHYSEDEFSSYDLKIAQITYELS